MTYDEAAKQLPEGAEWSASFGNPGEGGYVEIFRTPAGRRFKVGNGRWDALQPFDWTVEEIEPAPRPTEIDDGMGGRYRPGIILSVEE